MIGRGRHMANLLELIVSYYNFVNVCSVLFDIDA